MVSATSMNDSSYCANFSGLISTLISSRRVPLSATLLISGISNISFRRSSPIFLIRWLSISPNSATLITGKPWLETRDRSFFGFVGEVFRGDCVDGGFDIGYRLIYVVVSALQLNNDGADAFA